MPSKDLRAARSATPASKPEPAVPDAGASMEGRIEASVEASVKARTEQLTMANARLRDAERQHRLVLQNLPDILVRYARDTTILDISGPVQFMVAAPGDLIGTRMDDRADMSFEARELLSGAIRAALDSGRAQTCEYRLDVLAGDLEFEARIMPMGSDEALAIVREVTERNRLREQLQHLAEHDELTGLLNRATFLTRLNRGLSERASQRSLQQAPGQRREAALAVMVVDLDRFKQINDTLGHGSGDTLLKIAANRMTRVAGAECIAARIGADEFALAMPCTGASLREVHADAERIVQALIAEIGDKMRIHGRTLHVAASFGIALYPRDGSDADALLRNAGVAMSRAKHAGGGHAYYQPEIGEHVARRFDSEQGLRNALARDELAIVYLPKIDLSSGALIGVEALVRWNTIDGRMLLPSRFIPLAEQTGLIKPVGRWVLREALRQMNLLASQGRPPVDLSVNVSALQLRDREFLEEIRSALAEHAFPAARLTLEVAETAFAEDLRIVSEALAEISSLGVKISIDDFGTGFAGLSVLKNLPVGEIKIDRSFIKGCAIDAHDATIVSGLVDMLHNLGLKVVAEGVERADQIAFLTQVKCDMIQGYFIGMPIGIGELGRSDSLWRRTPV